LQDADFGLACLFMNMSCAGGVARRAEAGSPCAVRWMLRS